MKQAILTFEKKSVLLVELPEDITNIVVYDCPLHNCHKIVFTSKKQDPGQCGGDMVPLGHYVELIGKLSELTEEQFAEIVDKDRSGYKDYDEEGICSIYPFIGAKGSFLSKLRADGYITEMPEIKEDPSDFGPGWDLGYGGFPQRIVEEIDAANARLFSPDKTWVFAIKQ